MKTGIIILICALTLCAGSALAQCKGSGNFWRPFAADKPVLFKSTTAQDLRPYGLKTERIINLDYNCAPQAFFCKMEERSLQTFHLVIKFRAGNDEMYRNLINVR